MQQGGPPDFVGVGAQRCGTTWWYELICAHPNVRRGPKELHFFDSFCEQPMNEAHIEEYWRAFPRANGELTGEWTPRYAHDFWTPPLLHRAAPEAKLLLLTRDPIARLRSGIHHQRQLTPPRNEVELATICAEAGIRGRYGEQLSRILRRFPRQQILVLQYERCCADPKGELHRTYEFLGLEPSFVPTDLDLARRIGPSTPMVTTPDEAGVALAEELKDDVAKLARLVPSLDLGLWTEFSQAVAEL